MNCELSITNYYDKEKLQINLLQDGVYVESTESLNFPNLPLVDIIPQYLEQSRTAVRNATMKAFRQWVKSQGVMNYEL